MQEKCGIEYPCQWQFKIIGTDKEALKKAAAVIFKKKYYAISHSKSSTGEKYHSFSIETEVNDEKCRNDFYFSLKKHPAIKMVL